MLSIIREAYVDSVNMQDLENKTLNEMLSNLDPHSAYIPAEELQKANEPLEGNFDGIGVEFNIVNDTIMVVSAINGGPSQELGIKAGDRIIKVDTTLVAGVKITNDNVIKLLRGKRGTQVNVTIYRPYENQELRLYHYSKHHSYL
jgi:carboxyl-terminal processing protease